MALQRLQAAEFAIIGIHNHLVDRRCRWHEIPASRGSAGDRHVFWWMLQVKTVSKNTRSGVCLSGCPCEDPVEGVSLASRISPCTGITKCHVTQHSAVRIQRIPREFPDTTEQNTNIAGYRQQRPNFTTRPTNSHRRNSPTASGRLELLYHATGRVDRMRVTCH